MALKKIPAELIYCIASFIDDSWDYNAFQQVDQRTYAIIHPSFNSRYNYPDNWYEPEVPWFDYEIYGYTRDRGIHLGTLIWHSCKRGYYRLTKALIKRGALVSHAIDLMIRGESNHQLHPIVAAESYGMLTEVRPKEFRDCRRL
jgi:hypothetical protein